MLLTFVVTSALLVTSAVIPAAATPITASRRENKSTDLEEEGKQYC